jgi:uncharacterized protein YndB with AHSA1/START domain
VRDDDPVIEQTETQILVQVVVPVPAADLFALLADPRRHAEIDGSGLVQGDVDAQPVTAVGQSFTMQQSDPRRGDYRTDNEVIAYEPDRLIAWSTADAGQPPAGVRWRWQLDPAGPGRTTVVHTYDWTNVSDPEVLAAGAFPRVPAVALRQSIRRLVALAAAG